MDDLNENPRPINRREFLFSAIATGGLAGLGSKTPLSQFVSFRSRDDYDREAFLKATTVGQIHGDILLLPADTPLPEIVSQPKHGFPIFCSAGVGRGGPVPEVVAVNIPTDELSKLISLTGKPFYELREVPEKYFKPLTATLHLHNHSREVFSSFLAYQYHDVDIGNITGVNITVNYDPYLPYPVWMPSDSDQVIAPIELLTDLPQPGVKIYSALGSIFQWVEDNALYSVHFEGLMSEDLQLQMPSILKRIGE